MVEQREGSSEILLTFEDYKVLAMQSLKADIDSRMAEIQEKLDDIRSIIKENTFSETNL